MPSQPPLLSSTGFSLFTGNVPVSLESNDEPSFPAPKKSSPSGADTGFSFSAGAKSSGSSLPGADTEFSFSVPRVPPPSTLSEADTGFKFSVGTISATSSLLDTDTGLLSPADTISSGPSRSGSGDDSGVGASLSGSEDDAIAVMSEVIDDDKATPTHDTTLTLQNQGQHPREQKQQQGYRLIEAYDKEREPKQRLLALLSYPKGPSLATALYTTTLTSFGLILLPTVSIFVHLLSMLSIGSLKRKIRQFERENGKKDDTIKRLEEKILLLEERERGLWRGEDLGF